MSTPNGNGNANDIPFLDLVTPHVELEQELTKIFQQGLRTAGFIGGPMVEEFEKAFADCAEDRDWLVPARPRRRRRRIRIR